MTDFSLDANSMDDDAPKTRSVTSGGGDPINWVVVAEMPGLTPANIVAGRLRSHGYLVRVWQESAGVATGLTVGLLGTGYVMVPEEQAEEARELINDRPRPRKSENE